MGVVHQMDKPRATTVKEGYSRSVEWWRGWHRANIWASKKPTSKQHLHISNAWQIVVLFGVFGQVGG